jgi:hypothetical protein
MKTIYESIPHLVLLIISWALLLCALFFHLAQGLDLPYLNMLFIIIGAGILYLPTIICGEEHGNTLRRKLLWILVLAAFIIFSGDLIRLIL